MATWPSAAVNWPDLYSNQEYYVDIILYAKKPIYFIPYENIESGTVSYNMYANKYAGASFVYTISHTVGATESFMVTVRRVLSQLVSKPEDLVRQGGPLERSHKVDFDSSDALGRYIYQSSIGFFACFMTRQGNVILRAPRWTGDFNYGISCACTGPASSGYNPRTDTWSVPVAIGTYSENGQPLVAKPVEGTPDVFEKNFRYIADVMTDMQSLSLANSDVEYVNNRQVYKVVKFFNQQTPWLNNPTTWSEEP